MKRQLNIAKYSLCILFITQLFNSCSSAEGKSNARMHHVHIKNMKFEPAQLTVNKGDTVVWTNLDFVTHDVTEIKNKTWSSSPLIKGKTWKLVVKQSADYYCSIHVMMKGEITVN